MKNRVRVIVLFLPIALFGLHSVYANLKNIISCSNLKSLKDMKCVPGGDFFRGSDHKSKKLCCLNITGRHLADEFPPARISIDTFYMDTYEVTYGDFQECILKGPCDPREKPHYRWARLNKNGPILGISWYQARAYCSWRGKRLPTESEWEKAARGPNGDLYPWGNQKPNCARAVIREKGKAGCGKGITWSVGSMPAGRYGLYDMAGNAHEWVADWYSPSYKKCGPDCFGHNPKGPCKGALYCKGHKYKVVKGGSWFWPKAYVRAAHRRPHYPGNKKKYHHFGFRCARTVHSNDTIDN